MVADRQEEFYRAMYQTVMTMPSEAIADELANDPNYPFVPQAFPKPFTHVDASDLTLDDVAAGVAVEIPRTIAELETPGRGAFLGLRSVDTIEEVRNRTTVSVKQATGGNAAILPGFAQGEILVRRVDPRQSLLDSRGPIVGLERRPVLVDATGHGARRSVYGAYNFPVAGNETVVPERADGATLETRPATVPDRSDMRLLERNVVAEAQDDPAAALRNKRHLVARWEAAVPRVTETAMIKTEHQRVQGALGHRPARDRVHSAAQGTAVYSAGGVNHSVFSDVVDPERGVVRNFEARLPGADVAFDHAQGLRSDGGSVGELKQMRKTERVIVEPPEDVGNAQTNRLNQAFRHVVLAEGRAVQAVDKRDLDAAYALLAGPDVLRETVARVRTSNPFHLELCEMQI